MPSNITAPRVPLTDPRTDLISREWYQFFLELFRLTGSGQNVASITDLQVGPPSFDIGEVQSILYQMDADPSTDGLREHVASLTKAVQGLQEAPAESGAISQIAALFKQVQGLQVAPPAPDTTAFSKGIQGLQAGDPTPAILARQAEMLKRIQSIEVGPPTIPSTAGAVMTAVATLDFPNTLAQLSSDLTITVPGVVDGDVVALGIPNACVLPDSCYTGWVSAPSTVTVRFNNYSVGAQNPPSGDFRAVVTRL